MPSVTRLFWNAPPPCLLEHGARDSDGTAVQSGRHTQARESQGYAARPRGTTRFQGTSSGAGQGTWTRPRSNQRHKLVSEPRATAIGRRRRGKRSCHAEEPAGLQPSGEEDQRAVLDSRIQEIGAKSSSGIAIAAPAVSILSCCGLQTEGRVALLLLVGCVEKSLVL